MADLSPAAQAVSDAFYSLNPDLCPDYCLAAALRAVALLALPPENDKRGICHSFIRDEILAIAVELEATD